MKRGGYRTKGRTAEERGFSLNEARAIEENGGFALVLELVDPSAAAVCPRRLAALSRQRLRVLGEVEKASEPHISGCTAYPRRKELKGEAENQGTGIRLRKDQVSRQKNAFRLCY